MTIIPLTLNTRTLELDLERKTLAIRDGEARIELSRVEAAQTVSFLLAHPTFFEDHAVLGDVPPAIPIVPTMTSLLEDGFSADRSNNVLMGVHVSTGEPYWSTWQDFRSGAVGGRGRTGVTNTLAFLIVQAILGYIEVWIADLHFNKSSSLTALLHPLAPRVRLAGTTDDIAHLFEDWGSEMERRKVESGPFKPLLVVFDGWSSILEQFGVEGKEVGDAEFYRKEAVSTVTRCAREMGGYEMYVLLGVYAFDEQEIGNVALRRLIHTLICHRMPSEYSRHILPKKQADLTQGMHTGQCILKDNEGFCSLLAIPLVSIEDIATIERLLREAE